jgi:hypothetical protein
VRLLGGAKDRLLNALDDPDADLTDTYLVVVDFHY